jgi:hypothetical protein
MKNIYLYQTDQPTGIFETNSGLQFSIMNKVRHGEFKGYNIYITSSEAIKEGDWYLNIEEKNGIKNPFYGKLYKANQSICQVPLDYLVNNLKKIILTTDLTLISDGVQSISDEFLEWFVKNPTCEFVEVNKKLVEFPLTFKMMYKIIIPQDEPKQEQQKQHLINMMHDDEELGLYEEPKQETQCYCGHTTYCDCGPLEEPKQIYYNTVGRENGKFVIKGQFNTQKEALDLANELNKKFPDLYYDWNETLIKEEKQD